MIDGKEVGAAKLPVTIPLQLGLGASVVVGADTGSPVMPAEDYKPPFAFTGTVKKALGDVSGEVTENLEAKVKMYLARQ
jgi:arylsulfatase